MPSPLLTVFAPAALVVAGVGAGVVALRDDGGSAVATDAVWIDAPFESARLPEGEVRVMAHATDLEPLATLELVVDDEVVATDDDLVAEGNAAQAEMVWEATAGIHVLVVRSDTGLRSASRTVIVGDEPTGSTTTTIGGGTTTSTTTADTTTTTVASTTTTTGGAPTTGSPGTTAPPTTAAAAPVITSAQLLPGAFGNLKVYVPAGCPAYYVDVQASISGAVTSARVRLYNNVTGHTVTLSPAMTKVSGVYRFRITSGQVGTEAGDSAVSIVATGPGGTATRQVDLLDVRPTCPKD